MVGGDEPMKNGKREKRMEICLCSNCASSFFHSPNYTIHRSDPIQVRMDMCDCCRTRRGYDFRIAPRYRK